MKLTERDGGPFLEHLAATVAVRSVLREVVALAGEAPQIGDQALRARLITMLPPLWRGIPNASPLVTPGRVL